MIDEIIAPLMTTEWGRRSGVGVVIVMACLLLYTCLNMVFVWRADYLAAHAKSLAVNVAGTDHMAQWIADIPNAHLFGKYGAQTTGLKVTALQIHLVGVIKAVPEKYSRVIISEGSEPGKVYQVGDVLSSGVKVYAITEEGVVLENSGTLEKLPLQREGLTFQGLPKPLLSKESSGDNQ